MNKDTIEKDKLTTYLNKDKLSKNINLLYWYERLYDRIKFKLNSKKKILEIGSGTSPLKYFYPDILTSDYLQLDYLDFSFDCHEIDKVSQINDNSIDIVILTNVVHHLYHPVKFFLALRSKLKLNAEIICLEPFPSFFSYPLYKLFHIEPMVFNITEPKLESQDGPLSGSNQAIPYLLFFKNYNWFKNFKTGYDWNENSIEYYTFLSYFLTGGISRNFQIPHWLYKIIFDIDYFLSKIFPRIFASFFELTIIFKGNSNEVENIN